MDSPTASSPGNTPNTAGPGGAGAKPQTLSFTPKAAEKLNAILAQKGLPGGFLRVKVTSGGCSGLNLEFELSNVLAQDDKVCESNGAKAAVDPKSEFFLFGSTVDYQSSLMKSGFILQNPNAKDSCACGTSFSV